MTYEIVFTASAVRDLESLPKPVTGFRSTRRGEYRVIDRVDDDVITVNRPR